MQVGILLRGKLVNLNAHSSQLNLGNLGIYLLRQHIDLVFQLVMVLHNMQGGEELHAPAQIHNLSRMAVTAGEIYHKFEIKCGISSGAAYFAARTLRKQAEGDIVVVLPDNGERYPQSLYE